MDVDSSCVSTQVSGSELFEYSHMVVPSTMRSPYWRYFGFPCDNYNNIVTKKKIICTLCSTAISYNKNTTNLRTHLVAKHPDALYQLNDRKRTKTDDKNPDSSEDCKMKIRNIKAISEKEFHELNADEEQTKINEQTAIIEALVENDILENDSEKISERNDYQEFSSSLDPQTYQVEEIDESAAPTQEIINESLTDMLTRDLLPPSIVEGQGFTNFIFTISPNIVLPNRKRIENQLRNSYQTTFNSHLETIKSHANKNSFSLGFEVWTNVEQMQFLNVYINFISQQQNEQRLKQFLFKTVCISDSINLDIFEGINMTKCSGAVTNYEEDIINNFCTAHGIPTVPCFATVIQECLQLAFKMPHVECVYEEVQKYLKANEPTTCQDDSTIPQLHEKFALTKLNLLTYFYDKYSNSYSSWTEEASELLDKTKEIICCLSPLKVTLETLSDEPVALCSLLKPLTTKLLNEYFCLYDEDSTIVATLKETVSRKLINCIHKTFLMEATFFDPRFLNYTYTDNFQMIKDIISSKLQKAKDETNGSDKSEGDKQSIRRSSLKMFFQSNELKHNSKVVKTTSELEIQKYMNELCDMEQCPLTWWHECGYVYRNLKAIAQNYLCIPATVNNNFKRSITEQIDFYNKQQMIKSDCERNLLFLHFNKMHDT
ncbi:E3 SUMO-protein ligase ZBED1 [Hermetia illucens]|uniref:E3 SUMO-protein ligase ZBED1 n=1 Tax=Hermetia illucens TaxID=343691 RepID=UPI0018CC0191|nr:E3 SUMO-protein ligase ZBED1 [Hermetia illucens]XP_037915251.1 E3 SUMO-protein ligase ZBED1 [Hermetia illucens]